MGGGLATPFEGARKLTHEVTSCTVHALHGHMCAGIWHWVGWPFKMVAWTRSEPSVLCVAIGAGVVPRMRVPEGYCFAHWGMGLKKKIKKIKKKSFLRITIKDFACL